MYSESSKGKHSEFDEIFDQVFDETSDSLRKNNDYRTAVHDSHIERRNGNYIDFARNDWTQYESNMVIAIEKSKLQAAQEEKEKDARLLSEKEEAEQIAIALRMSKMLEEKRQKEEKQKKLNELIDKMKEKLKSMLISLSDSDFQCIEHLLNEYECESGRSLIPEVGYRDCLTLNGKSSLVLEVIQLLKGLDDISIEVIIKSFEWHIQSVHKICCARQQIHTYDPKHHDLDPTSLFTHRSIEDKLVTVNVKGDGNCLWNCISIALFGDYSMMESLRLLTASTLISNKEQFTEYLTDQKLKYGYTHELTFDELVGAAVELQVWGDELHIMALSLALERPIYSYGSLNSSDYMFASNYDKFKEEYEKDSLANHFKYVADSAFEKQTPILLYYNGENHYSVVLPKENGVKPPAPKSQLLDPLFGSKNIECNEIKSRQQRCEELLDNSRVEKSTELLDLHDIGFESQTKIIADLNNEVIELMKKLSYSEILRKQLQKELDLVLLEKQELTVKVQKLEDWKTQIQNKMQENKSKNNTNRPGTSTNLFQENNSERYRTINNDLIRKIDHAQSKEANSCKNEQDNSMEID